MSFRKFVFFSAVMSFGFAAAARAQVGVYGMATGQQFGGVTCPSYAAPCASNDGVTRPYGGTFGLYYDWKKVGPVILGADARGDVLTTNKRGDSSAGGKGTVREYTALFGVRATVPLRYRWLHPYVEVAGGYTRNNNSGLYTTTTTTTTFSPTSTTVLPVTSSLSFNPAYSSNYGVMKGYVGADITLFPFLDLRFELGDGAAFGEAQTTQSLSTANVVDNNPGTKTNPNPTYGQIISSTSKVTGTGFGQSTHQIPSIGAGFVLHLPR
jgi:hypothetical protein